MLAKTFDALVVGGGIVGSACARELAEAGLRVGICEESDHIGGGATAAGMGHIAVMDDSEAQFALTSYSQRLWRQLSGELPPTAEYMSNGSLWIAADEEEFLEVHRKYRFYAKRGIAVEILDSRQTAEAEPQLRPGLAGALRMPSDGVCYPPCAAGYFARQAEIRFNERVVGISEEGATIADGTTVTAGVTIVATGASVARLMPDAAVYPRKGHLLITDRYPGFLQHQLIELGYLKSAHSSTADSIAFNAQPRATGQILIGSSRQYKVEEPAVEPKMLSAMLKRAIEYMPDLKYLSAIRTWTGFRAATPDKLPLIGLSPGYQKVYLATGHEGLGISTSLATARLLADQILDRPSEISRAPYEPGRSFAPHA
jgi:glycine/D-amino acid oxidase-like deaminating enzyme